MRLLPPKTYQPKAHGFTLVEIMVVIAIIGILAAIVLTFLGGAREKAKSASIMSEMKSLQTVLMSHFFIENETPILGTDCVMIMSPNSDRPCDNESCRNARNLLIDIKLQAGDTGERMIKNGYVVCTIQSETNWCIVSSLPDDRSKSFCIDGNGANKKLNRPVTIGEHAGTSACNANNDVTRPQCKED